MARLRLPRRFRPVVSSASSLRSASSLWPVVGASGCGRPVVGASGSVCGRGSGVCLGQCAAGLGWVGGLARTGAGELATGSFKLAARVHACACACADRAGLEQPDAQPLT
ncbi:hypothetical protein Psuf_036330 [Phytohabitans suffuscus]|uniref:Uncharacterized protein n=1 Tax=Phytohabitans suffuscus TaxID=624315 RepID=A0A6F8YJR6_9ACTN|nr:hypothetical protein Psuf_036330 [Phytohabitans suffuscus]